MNHPLSEGFGKVSTDIFGKQKVQIFPLELLNSVSCQRQLKAIGKGNKPNRASCTYAYRADVHVLIESMQMY